MANKSNSTHIIHTLTENQFLHSSYTQMGSFSIPEDPQFYPELTPRLRSLGVTSFLYETIQHQGLRDVSVEVSVWECHCYYRTYMSAGICRLSVYYMVYYGVSTHNYMNYYVYN